MLSVGIFGYAIWHWLLVPLQLQALHLFVFLPLNVLLIAPVLKLLTVRCRLALRWAMAVVAGQCRRARTGLDQCAK
jgi:hypothetical protein